MQNTFIRQIAWAAIVLTLIVLKASGGNLYGQVTGPGGVPIPWVFVDLYDASGAYFDYTSTDAAGVYYFENLGTGDFYVHTDTLGAYVDQWYDQVSGAAANVFYDPVAAGATLVSVQWWQWVFGIDFALVPAAAVEGRVRGAGNAPITNAYVDAYLPDGTRFSSGLTGSDGRYRIGGLPAGSYAIRTDTLGDFVDQWQDGSVAFDSITPAEAGIPLLNLSQGQPSAGIDFQLAAGATLGGQVVDAGDLPVSGIYLDLYDATGARVEFDRTDTNGVFTLDGLPAGTYYLGTDALGAYVDIWYDHRLLTHTDNTPDPIQDQADPLFLSVAEQRTNIVLHMNAGAEISGYVVDALGDPITNAFVDLYLANLWFDYAASDATGAFHLTALPEGTYYARVDTFGDYLDEWYSDRVILHIDDPVADGAQPLVLTNGIPVTNVVFTLDVGAEISGALIGPAGQPIVDGYLDLFNADGERLFYTQSASNGTYRLGGLPAGAYYLATDTEGRFLDEWYDDQVIFSRINPVSDQATALTLAHQQSRTNIQVELRLGGSISGIVTGPQGALAYTYVELFHGSNYFDFAITDTNGWYELRTLPAATYYLQTDNADELVNEWYQDVYIFHEGLPEEDGANPVLLGVDEQRTNTHFVLSWGGDIEGTVVDTDGSPLEGVFVDVFDANGRYYDFALSQTNGAFWMEVLPPGTWYLGTDTFGDYQDEWFDDVLRLDIGGPIADGATPVTLEDGTVLVGLSITLQSPPANPVSTSLTLTSTGTLQVEWLGEANRTYQVERCDSLILGSWTNGPSGSTELETSLKLPAPTGPRIYVDPTPPPPSANYRVVAQ